MQHGKGQRSCVLCGRCPPGVEWRAMRFVTCALPRRGEYNTRVFISHAMRVADGKPLISRGIDKGLPGVLFYVTTTHILDTTVDYTGMITSTINVFLFRARCALPMKASVLSRGLQKFARSIVYITTTYIKGTKVFILTSVGVLLTVLSGLGFLCCYVNRLVLDLSCRRRPGGSERGDFLVVTDKWQKFTRFAVTRDNLERLAAYCDEFLVHGVDAEVCPVFSWCVSYLLSPSHRSVYIPWNPFESG